MKDSFEQGLEATKQIMETVIAKFEVEGNLNQMQLQIHPIISNVLSHRDKEVLEAERFKTLIALSRALDDENINKAITALKYELTVRK